MKQPQDDNQLRELLQRVKQADEQRAPTFDAVMTRSMEEVRPGHERRRQLTVGVCIVAALLVALFVRAQFDVSSTNDEPTIAKNPTRSVTDPPGSPNDGASEEGLVAIDFDELLKAVDDHLPMAELDSENMSVWSSRTDSLLALNVNVPLSDQDGSQ